MAEMATKLVSSRLIVRESARSLDAGLPSAPSLCAMAKLHATDNCFEVEKLNFVFMVLFIPYNLKIAKSSLPLNSR